MTKRPKKKRKGPVQLRMGVAWYRPEQWERLRGMVPDPGALEETYNEWVAMATRELSRLAEHGMVLEKVYVDVEELLAWCNERGRAVDGEARAEFAGVKLQERDRLGR